MPSKSHEYAFVVADHPERFRADKVRRSIKRHVLNDSRRKRGSNLSKKGSKDEPCVIETLVDSDDDHTTNASPERATGVKKESQFTMVLDFRKSRAVGQVRKEATRDAEPPIAPMMDYFRLLPRSNNKLIDFGTLVGTWWRAFGRCAPPKILDFVITSEMAMTSYCLSAALFRSVNIRQPGRSIEYLTSRHNSIQTINSHLKNPQWPSELIICVKHLLFADIYCGTTEALRSHVIGIDKLVGLRGGLDALPLDGQLSNLLRIHVLWACVIANIRAPKAFIDAETPAAPFFDSISSITRLPSRVNESPLVWWSEHMTSLHQSEYYTPRAHSLLCELRDLTEELLEVGYISAQAKSPRYQHILRSYSISMIPVPPRFKSDSDRRKAWIQESCRLAGLIYAAALAHHVPISQAHKKLGNDLQEPFIVDDLGSAIVKSEFYSGTQVWGEMVGCYLWVTMVSGALGHRNFDHLQGELRDSVMLQRALLTQPATYTFQLFHEPPLAEGAYQNIKAMLRAQEILDRKPSPVLDTMTYESAAESNVPLVRGKPLKTLYEMADDSCTRADFDPTAFKLPERSPEGNLTP